MSNRITRSPRTAFSLVELLVVVGVIGILVGLLLPAVQKVREAANRTKCLNNLKQIGIAIHNYENNFQKFPPAGLYPTGVTSSDVYSIQARILPFIEQANLYSLIDLNAVPGTQLNVIRQRIAIYMLKKLSIISKKLSIVTDSSIQIAFLECCYLLSLSIHF